MFRVASITFAALAACGPPRGAAPAAAPLSNAPSSAPADAPSPAVAPPSLTGLSPEQRCDAVAPRTRPCLRELTLAELGTDASETDLKALVATENWESMSRDEAQRIHQLHCLASLADSYAASVVACWDERACEPFARCVAAAEDRAAAPRNRPRED